MKKTNDMMNNLLFFLFLYIFSFYIAFINMDSEKLYKVKVMEEKKNVSALPFMQESFALGDENLFKEPYFKLIKDKTVGIITNGTGVNQWEESTINVLIKRNLKPKVIVIPKMYIGDKVSYEDIDRDRYKSLGISIKDMDEKEYNTFYDIAQNCDVILYDIQDLGIRNHSTLGTLKSALEAVKKSGKTLVVLDRPNPFGGVLVEGPLPEEVYKEVYSNVKIPVIHGMTIGEIAKLINEPIGASLSVVPMSAYNRSMLYEDTVMELKGINGLKNIEALHNYSLNYFLSSINVSFTEDFKGINYKNMNMKKLSELLNESHISGVSFYPQDNGRRGIVLDISEPKAFKPFNTYINILYCMKSLKSSLFFNDKEVEKLDRIMGTKTIRDMINKNYSPHSIENSYENYLEDFKSLREKYLIYR